MAAFLLLSATLKLTALITTVTCSSDIIYSTSTCGTKDINIDISNAESLQLLERAFTGAGGNIVSVQTRIAKKEEESSIPVPFTLITKTQPITTETTSPATTVARESRITTTTARGSEPVITSKAQQHKACNVSFFTFTAHTHNDYVLYDGSLPEMSSLTVCAWIKPASGTASVKGSLISYCVKGASYCNTFWVLLLSNRQFMYVFVNSVVHNFSSVPYIETRSHLCVVVQPNDVGFYINGDEPMNKIDRADSKNIPAGGVLILGQDQDGEIKGRSPGKPENPAQGLLGEIEGLRLWKRGLSTEEIAEVYNEECHCSTFDESNSILHGHVTAHYDICNG